MIEQDIRTRMIQKAASIWGVSPNEIDSTFDPVIALIIGACASEIEKIESNLKESQTRITERLIQLMTPEVIYGARPSHAIAYSEPVEATSVIQPENLQYYKKRIETKSTEYEYRNIFFSPTRKMTLINANVTHLVCGDKLFEVSPHAKNTYLHTLKKYAVPSKMYLGIKAYTDNVPLKDVALFFELQNVAFKDIFYHHLQNANCYFNSEKLETISGFYDSEHSDKADVDVFLNTVSSKTHNIEIQTNQFYEKHFITLKSISYLEKNGNIIENQFTAQELEKYPELAELNWLEIEFPRIIDTALLEHVFCTLNAYPVSNRKLNSFSYQIKDYINIIPITSDDLFLDVKSVENLEGKKYKLRNTITNNETKGTFVLRDKNIGKLDSRSAKQYLKHMLELLKNESASFSHLGIDFLSTNIEKVNQTISLIEKKIEDFNRLSEETIYLSLNPYGVKETIEIDYWTTNGALGNKIKANSTLQVYKSTMLKQDSGVLLTGTFQGKDNYSMDERLSAYRRALLSRDRIVTKEDVKALCNVIYSNRIESVNVKKSYSTTIAPKTGVIPCIEIILHSSDKIKTSDSEWQFLENSLLTILEKQSLNVFPYKVTKI